MDINLDVEYVLDMAMELLNIPSPVGYTDDAMERIGVELDELKVELIDRFGLLPEATKNLLQIAEMRLMVKPLKVLKIDAGAQGGFIEFSPSAKVDPEKFIKLIQQNPIVYRFDGPLKFKFVKALPENKERLEFVMDLVKMLTE